MEKIDTFTITGLTVQGFKCFAEKRTFEFGSINTITGHNGQGKSSIADAIAYAITGVPFFGEGSLDRLYTLDSKNVSVELDLQTLDGAMHKLTRSRVNDVTTVTYDGVTVKQSDMYALFGEKDVFLSIFNPLYFIEVLEDKGRNLLERYLPVIPHEAVLESLGENSRKQLESMEMRSPESLLESVRAGIRELEDTVIYVEGQRDIIASQAREGKELLKAKREEIDKLDISIAELERRRAEGLNFDAIREKLDNHYARYDELSHERFTAPDTTAIDAEIQEAVAKLEKRRAEEYESKFTGQISDGQALINQLRERYTREMAIYNALSPGIECPTCKQAVTEQNIDSVKAAFAESAKKVLVEGRERTSQLAELKELDEKAKSVFEEFRVEDIVKLESDYDDLQRWRLGILTDSKNDFEARETDMDSLKGQIQTLELDLRFGNLAPDDGFILESLKKDREKLESELAILNDAQGIASSNDRDTDIESIKNSIKSKRELEDAIKAYISMRASKMLAALGELNRIGITLYEPVKKNGEVRDVFKFTFDGKPYKFLSLSEKIRAGLEVSELMKRLNHSNYPVFIDNGESVPVIDNVRPSGQIFIAQVSKGAPLSVEIQGAPAQKAAA